MKKNFRTQNLKFQARNPNVFDVQKFLCLLYIQNLKLKIDNFKFKNINTKLEIQMCSMFKKFKLKILNSKISIQSSKYKCVLCPKISVLTLYSTSQTQNWKFWIQNFQYHILKAKLFILMHISKSLAQQKMLEIQDPKWNF